MSTSRLNKRKARRIARVAWIASGGDIAKAEELMKASHELSKLDAATVLALLQIALMLWKWWNENNKKSPPLLPESNEPVNYESDE
jgi:hypothetical protein